MNTILKKFDAFANSDLIELGLQDKKVELLCEKTRLGMIGWRYIKANVLYTLYIGRSEDDTIIIEVANDLKFTDKTFNLFINQVNHNSTQSDIVKLLTYAKQNIICEQNKFIN